MSQDTKPCEHCATTFSRRDKDGPARWAGRRFCSRGCAGKFFAYHPAKLAGIQARYDRPGERERHAERRREISVRTWADPVKRASMTQASAERIDQTLNSPHARARAACPETRAKAAASYSRTMRAWCPADRWEDYQALRRQKMSGAQAKALILADIEAVARRAVAKVKADMIARRERERREAY